MARHVKIASHKNTLLAHPPITLQAKRALGIIHGNGHEDAQELATRLQEIDRDTITKLINFHLFHQPTSIIPNYNIQRWESPNAKPANPNANKQI